MIDVKLLRENPEKFKKAIAAKQADPKLIDDFLAVDEGWKKLVRELDDMRAWQKKLGEEKKIDEAKALKEQIKSREVTLEELDGKRSGILKRIPNPPLDTVPTGSDESGNVTLREVGKRPVFKFKPKDYIDIAESLNLIDTERAGKVSGSRFGYLLNETVRLEFALAQFALATLTDKKAVGKLIKQNKLNIPNFPFVPVVPPVLIKKEMMEGMGYVERGSDEIYFLPKDDLYLVGTSEQSIGPMHSGEILSEDELPKRYLGFSTCFRREAGSYGKDTKGILRVHQFDKLEMFSITKPEWSAEEHKLLLVIEEHLTSSLGLCFKVLSNCAGELGDPAAAKYDIETWMPGQQGGKGEYRETSSTSNTTDFQSRRLGVKFRKKDGASELTHMLNGTAFAIGRTLIAILENYQREDGSVVVPKVLQKYAGIKEIKPSKRRVL